MAPVALTPGSGRFTPLSPSDSVDLSSRHAYMKDTSLIDSCQSINKLATLPTTFSPTTIPQPSTLSPVRSDVLLFHKYHMGEMLGEGRYGAVWECAHRQSGQRLACKQVDKDASPEGAVELELSCLAAAQGHPNVLQLEGLYEGRQHIYLLTEVCDAGDLYDHICANGHLEESDVKSVFRQVVSAVSHCHSKGVIHRDIKPENVLLRRCRTTGQLTAKLADFGLATILRRGEKTTGWVGSKPYEAPEVVAQAEYDSSADVFSLGVLLYSMLSGNWPSFNKHKQFLAGKSFGYSRWSSVSAEAKDLITRMLNHTPWSRPAACEVLQSSWFYPLQKFPESNCMDDGEWSDRGASCMSAQEMESALLELLGSDMAYEGLVEGEAVAMVLEDLDLELHL